MSGEFSADIQIKNRAKSIITQVEQLQILTEVQKEEIKKIIESALINNLSKTKL